MGHVAYNLPYQQQPSASPFLANSPGGFQNGGGANLNGLGSPQYSGTMSPGAGRSNGNGAPGAYDNGPFANQLPS
ncbi:hypothetical protein HBI56_106480 [Parastagonospora nodorum]|uniref:Uncharacterized protein n=1 Tax=Phaeosphaeria nodorum (strain SN15 / ATCC MYA-4574 / FGSC 10173) TaxID=321614 RepID=Q0U9M0_PHANO|nr:hypothetical protein SNOG_11544 [Parastagonospora nodorum SN15]KAH3926916.1 hypothetical protein HBH54_160820 [Parastagonospora nodorum]EAT81252.1 hypothetical protein SNOG_11544 [Parastagonospora nodorum SN15]KAH3974573.1 hypothetical protein HBH52_134130 [Parastagonospora nodorum]KAH3977636.1 hypothetical protein HBH51_068510 [Parastagonospora nodorum]KAH3995999.1 hypothetical protein HBI10_165320 [Parastagonospora nodorum]